MDKLVTVLLELVVSERYPSATVTGNDGWDLNSQEPTLSTEGNLALPRT